MEIKSAEIYQRTIMCQYRIRLQLVLVHFLLDFNHWRGAWKKSKNSKNITMHGLGSLASWPTVPVFPGQSRFGILCPGIPNVVFGTPKCPGLASEVQGGTEIRMLSK